MLALWIASRKTMITLKNSFCLLKIRAPRPLSRAVDERLGSSPLSPRSLILDNVVCRLSRRFPVYSVVEPRRAARGRRVSIYNYMRRTALNFSAIYHACAGDPAYYSRRLSAVRKGGKSRAADKLNEAADVDQRVFGEQTIPQ